ncbi:cytochrome P450, partial [Desarmillaria ectypa]
IHELPIPKGTIILISTAGYNRNKDVWGQDAHVFDPERGLDVRSTKKDVSVGVYGNLYVFALPFEACIGWRFAILEMHAFLAELVNTFEFSVTIEAGRIRREPCGIMTPTVKGGERHPTAAQGEACISRRL